MKVAFLKVDDYNLSQIEKKIDEGINLIGGFENYFNRNDRILLKPNLLASDDPSKGVTTHPVFFEAVVKYFKNKNVKIFCGDSPAVSSGTKVAKDTGIYDVCERHNIPFIELKEKVLIKGHSKNIIKNFEISKEIQDFDKIISLPKLKNHSLTIFTGGIKNLFGVIPGKTKAYMHTRFPDREIFSKMLVDLADSIKTGICIMDGIIAHEGEGPRGGNPVKLGYIIIGENPFIVDLLAASLVGYNPNDIPMLKYFSEKHNVSLNLNDLQIFGDNLIYSKNFKKIYINKTSSSTRVLKNSFINKLISSKPYFIRKNCTMCLQCYNMCPTNPKSIMRKDKKLFYNYDTCIRCFCCQEICPSNAIGIKHSLINKILRKI